VRTGNQPPHAGSSARYVEADAVPLTINPVVAEARGLDVRLRAVCADDLFAIQEAAAHRLSLDDLRLRFFHLVRPPDRSGLGADLAAFRSGDAAVLAEDLKSGRLLATGRLVRVDVKRAEFAMVVASDVRGQGIGDLMITYLLRIAGDADYAEVTGLVLSENKPMLQLCRKHGFTVAVSADDLAVMVATKRLTADR
jgi:acetyltransferase